MTKNQIEGLAYDLILFLKKWSLWKGIMITCPGKSYSSQEDNTAGQWGFRDVKDVFVSTTDEYDWTADNEYGAPFVMRLYGTHLNELIAEENPTICLSQCSCTVREEVKKYVLEEWEHEPLLDDTEFDSREEHLAMKQELEDRRIHAEMGDVCRAGKEIAQRILSELDGLATRHGVFWDSPYGMHSPNDIVFLSLDA